MSGVFHFQGNAWGLFPWFAEHGLEEIHPDDRRLVSLISFGSRLFRLLYGDDEYVALEGAYGMLRVKPRLFQPIGSPQFGFGDAVQTTPPNTLRVGLIKEICWHHRHQREYYFIEVGGKSVSKRYWAEDLEAVEV
jgi:hypothetical protein